MRYFIYCRKSTESEDRQILSIDSQLAEVQRAFEGKPDIEILEVYRESFSAKAPGRPLFEQMLRRIERGEADGIIAWHPDRLARNSIDGGKIIYLLDRACIKDLKFSTFTFENNSQGKFMLSIIFSYSKYYVDNLSENVRRGNRAKAERGWRPNHAPLGYKNDRENKIIIPDLERFPLIRKMWDLMLTGAYSPQRICEIAQDDWGLRTPKRKRVGGRPVAVSAVYKILTNPFYAGILLWAGKTYPGKHEHMVTIDEFDQVQTLLGRPGRPKPQRHAFAYTGMIRCGECGLSVTAEDRVNRYGYHYVYYHCTKRKMGYHCRQPYIEVDKLERQILTFLHGISISAAPHKFALDQLRDAATEQGAKLEAQRTTLERTLTDTAKSLDNLTKLRIREMIDDEQFVAQRQALQHDQLRVQQSLARVDQGASRFEPYRLFVSFSNRAVSWYTEGDLETKRLVLEVVGSNLTLKNRILSIEARKPFRKEVGSPPFLDLCTAIYDVRIYDDLVKIAPTIKKLMEKHGDPENRAAA